MYRLFLLLLAINTPIACSQEKPLITGFNQTLYQYIAMRKQNISTHKLKSEKDKQKIIDSWKQQLENLMRCPAMVINNQPDQERPLIILLNLDEKK